MSDAKAETKARPGSGVFIRPTWKRMPNRFERGAAFTLVVVQVMGVWALTFLFGVFPSDLAAQLETELKKRQSQGTPPDRPLSAEVPARKSAKGSKAPPGQEPSVAASTYARGRRMMNVQMATLAGVTFKKGDRKTTMLASAVFAALLLVIGAVVSFFGWRLRRFASAIFGAAIFAIISATVASTFQLGTLSVLLVCLPMALLGALIGWHLVVLFTCVQASTVITVLAALPIFMITGFDQPERALPVLVAVWALSAVLIYVFMVRSLLISGWALWGAWIMGQALLVAVFGFTGFVMPWELYLLTVVVLAVLGVSVQYRLAARAAEDAPEPVPEPA